MSKHISFPAEHISAYEVGKRLRVIAKSGAKIEDVVTQVRIVSDNGANRVFLWFKNVPADDYGQRGFEVALDQMVKRIEDDE